MKKALLHCAAFAALALVVTAVDCAGSGGVKLVETITYGDWMAKFEYDDKNRIVKIHNYNNDSLEETRTLLYNGDALVASKSSQYMEGPERDMPFRRNGNTIHASDALGEYATTVNKDGNIMEHRIRSSGLVERFEYADGNVTAITAGWADTGENAGTMEFQYDKKKSPFFYCKTPQWFLQHLFGGSFRNRQSGNDIGLHNNITSWKYIPADGGLDSESAGYEYEYDADGFPTRRTETVPRENDRILTFTYRGETADIPAEPAADTNAVPGGAVTVQISSPAILSQYRSFIEHTDESASGAQKIVFTAAAPVRDFKYLAIQLVYDEEREQFTLLETAVHYSIDELLPARPLVVNWMPVGTFPHAGISYIDAHNVKRYFAIMDNTDAGPEEGGVPVFLSEYPAGSL